MRKAREVFWKEIIFDDPDFLFTMIFALCG
jgi:hypothetical protein